CSQTKAAKAAPDSAGESQSGTRKSARSCMSLSQRKEKHNSKERERRKRIRLCCDELNTLVPFCDSETDKVTTLQWTTAFLRYITKTYGDTFKEVSPCRTSSLMRKHSSVNPAQVRIQSTIGWMRH
uniref:BHLH domain-containing protein n=1 Tax=Amphilophus citrinellus TaxID=61819 RepID=A0A3Q0QSM6_AMPCI